MVKVVCERVMVESAIRSLPLRRVAQTTILQSNDLEGLTSSIKVYSLKLHDRCLTIVNGLVWCALLRTSCLGLTFREESGARYFEEI